MKATLTLGPLPGSTVGPGNWLGLTFTTGFYLLSFGEHLALISYPLIVFVLAGTFSYQGISQREAPSRKPPPHIHRFDKLLT
ncbi:MAG: hypothetical protein R6U57_14125 [Anaerolineales bacterium]